MCVCVCVCVCVCGLIMMMSVFVVPHDNSVTVSFMFTQPPKGKMMSNQL